MIGGKFKGETAVDIIGDKKNKNCIGGQLGQQVDNCVASLLVC